MKKVILCVYGVSSVLWMTAIWGFAGRHSPVQSKETDFSRSVEQNAPSDSPEESYRDRIRDLRERLQRIETFWKSLLGNRDAVASGFAELRQTDLEFQQGVNEWGHVFATSGVEETYPHDYIQPIAPLSDIADLLQLSDAQMAEFEEEYRNTWNRLEALGADLADVVQNGKDWRIEIPVFPEARAVVLEDWNRWVQSFLSPAQQETYRSLDMNVFLFDMFHWSPPYVLGKYPQKIEFKKFGSYVWGVHFVEKDGNRYVYDSMLDRQDSPQANQWRNKYQRFGLLNRKEVR